MSNTYQNGLVCEKQDPDFSLKPTQIQDIDLSKNASIILTTDCIYQRHRHYCI